MYPMFLLKRLTLPGFLLAVVSLASAQNVVRVKNNESAEDQYKFYFHQADDEMGKFQFRESIGSCEEALKYKPDDYLVRAIECLNYYEIAEKLDVKKSDEKEQKIRIYDKMVAIANDGIRRAPDKGECYFMRGLANARLATTKGIFSQLFTAKSIEQDWLVAVDRKSDYTTQHGENLQASANLALGVYYRLCPTFFLLKWMFGISGDLDKSVEYCKRAYELDSTRIEIVKEYGVALITRGLDRKNNDDIEAGKAFLRKVPTLPLRLHTDTIDIAHSKMLLNDISLCPGYSRDEQQDISEEAFEKEQKK
jgi:tetratricopeptide (TPR) repeat protein